MSAITCYYYFKIFCSQYTNFFVYPYHRVLKVYNKVGNKKRGLCNISFSILSSWNKGILLFSQERHQYLLGKYFYHLIGTGSYCCFCCWRCIAERLGTAALMHEFALSLGQKGIKRAIYNQYVFIHGLTFYRKQILLHHGAEILSFNVDPQINVSLFCLWSFS